MNDDILDLLPKRVQIEVIENTVRKDFTFRETCKIIDMCEPHLKAEARARRKAGAKLAPGRTKFKVRDALASALGVSNGQMDQILHIREAVEKNPREFGHIPEKIDRGMKISFAHQQIAKREKFDKPVPEGPRDEYDLGYMDFPWEFGLQTRIAPKYRTMTIQEGIEMKLALKKDAVLFFWTTISNISQAQQLLDHWGFEIKSEMIWVKIRNPNSPVKPEGLSSLLQKNPGHYVSGAHEKLYVCTRGNPGTPLVKPPSVVFARRVEHSSKPAVFRRLINEMYPNYTKIEYFARKRDEYHNNIWQWYHGDESQN